MYDVSLKMLKLKKLSFKEIFNPDVLSSIVATGTYAFVIFPGRQRKNS